MDTFNVHDPINNIFRRIWLKVIAISSLDSTATEQTSFYGLTHINNIVVESINHELLQNEPLSHSLFLHLQNEIFPSRFDFKLIPTEYLGPTTPDALAQYTSCNNITWIQLEGYGDPFWATLFDPTSSNISLQFLFPSFVSLADIVNMEEILLTRHICTLLPCSHFYLCPITTEPPDSSDYHLHCMSMTCVNFHNKVSYL